MKVIGTVVIAILVGFVGCAEDQYEVPEPLFEAFSPKGLRVSVPDSKDVKSVEFYLSVPALLDPLSYTANYSDGGYWTYWNPNVALQMYDKIQFKIMILHGDMYCKREGSHVILKVLPLSNRSNDTDCTENKEQQRLYSNQKITSKVPLLGNLEERKGLITSGKTSSLKSLYSMTKSSDLKPITKSTTSTTSGTFFVKPSGVMEATGFKKGSTFDSTKREGEQWEHYQSELTAEELENMKRLYESSLDGFPHLTDKFFPSSKVYEKKYMSSESKSFPGGFHTIGYQQGPITAQFHETHKTHESSSVSHSKPVFQFHYTDSAGSGSSYGSDRAEERSYRLEPLTKLPNPLPPTGTIFKTTEFVREEHTIPVGEVSQVHVDREVHRAAPQKIVQVSHSGEFSSHNQEVIKPSYGLISQSSEYSNHKQEMGKPFYGQASQVGEFSTHRQEIVKPVYNQVSSEKSNQFEYNSGNLQTVGRQDYVGRHYLGNIFTTVKNSKIKLPQECNLAPGIDYHPTGDIRELEKNVYELGCLATLAESIMKEEIALLRQKNAEYGRKLEQMEHEIKRLSSACNCSE